MQRRTTGKATNALTLLALRRHYTNPHQLYNALRVQDRLYFDETSQSWLITGHQAVTAILDDPRFFSRPGSATNTSSGHMSPISKQMLFMDGEQHRRAQDVMLRPLAQLVKGIAEDIRKFARDAIAAAQKGGTMDVVSEFASPISLFTIAHVLGIPLDDKDLLRQLEEWSDLFGDVTSGYFRGEMQNIHKLEEYFRHLIAEKRRVPGDDLLSAFIAARDVFSEEEDLIANCMMVFAAGRITTKKLLGNGISSLIERWEQHQKEYQQNPRFVKMLGEELLRVVTPTRYLMRDAGEDIDLSSMCPGQHLIRQNQRVLLFLEAADYDPAVFNQPEKFDPYRRPNKHIAFGYGPHQCPGATLARIEIQVALEEILALPHLLPKPGTSPIWNPNPNLGGFLANPVVFQHPS